MSRYYDRTAAKVALNKAAHPEKYCPTPRCLWRIAAHNPCPKHTPYMVTPMAPYKVQARQLATMYNALAEQERRPDLEEPE